MNQKNNEKTEIATGEVKYGRYSEVAGEDDIAEMSGIIGRMISGGFMIQDGNQTRAPSQNELFAVATVAQRYELDPLMGEIYVLGGKVYKATDALLRKAVESGQLSRPILERPATPDELKAHQVEIPEMMWVCEVWRTGFDHPCIGYGYGDYGNVGIARGKDRRTLRRMVAKRARRDALIKAFGISGAEPDTNQPINLGTIDVAQPVAAAALTGAAPVSLAERLASVTNKPDPSSGTETVDAEFEEAAEGAVETPSTEEVDAPEPTPDPEPAASAEPTPDPVPWRGDDEWEDEDRAIAASNIVERHGDAVKGWMRSCMESQAKRGGHVGDLITVVGRMLDNGEPPSVAWTSSQWADGVNAKSEMNDKARLFVLARYAMPDEDPRAAISALDKAKAAEMAVNWSALDRDALGERVAAFLSVAN